MPSKIKEIKFRLPWFRKRFGTKANLTAKAVLSNPGMQKLIEAETCPICKKPFDDCEYMRSLDDD